MPDRSKWGMARERLHTAATKADKAVPHQLMVGKNRHDATEAPAVQTM